MASDADRLDLAGHTALVTGAGRGIGLAVVRALAGCGVRVAICDRDAEALAACDGALREVGARSISAVLDVRDHDAMRRFLATAAAELGPLHALVNNAGGTFRADFDSLSQNGEDALIAANFTQVARTIRAVLPHLAPDGASIVNITSVEAQRAAPGFAVYAAMKAAVENLTRSLALELAHRRVRVNCVAPDAIPTPGTRGAAPPTPWPDAGRPEDVAGAVLFLVSDLSRFVTGTTLHVDGGTWAAGGWRRGTGGEWELG